MLLMQLIKDVRHVRRFRAQRLEEIFILLGMVQPIGKFPHIADNGLEKLKLRRQLGIPRFLKDMAETMQHGGNCPVFAVQNVQGVGHGSLLWALSNILNCQPKIAGRH